MGRPIEYAVPAAIAAAPTALSAGEATYASAPAVAAGATLAHLLRQKPTVDAPALVATAITAPDYPVAIQTIAAPAALVAMAAPGYAHETIAREAVTAATAAVATEGLGTENRESTRLAHEIVDAARNAVREAQQLLETNVFGEGNESERQRLATNHPTILDRDGQPIVPPQQLQTGFPGSFDAEGHLTPNAFDRSGIIGDDAIPSQESFAIAYHVLGSLRPDQFPTNQPNDADQPLEVRYKTRIDKVLRLMRKAVEGTGWKPADQRKPYKSFTLPQGHPLFDVLGQSATADFERAFNDVDVNHTTLDALTDAATAAQEPQQTAVPTPEPVTAAATLVAAEPLTQQDEQGHADAPADAPTTATTTPVAANGRPAGSLRHNGLFDGPMYQPQPATPTRVPHKVHVSWMGTGKRLGLPFHKILQNLRLTKQRFPDELSAHQQAVVEQSLQEAKATAQAKLPGSHVVAAETELMRELGPFLRRFHLGRHHVPTAHAHEARTTVEVITPDGRQYAVTPGGAARAELPKVHRRRN